MSQNLLTIHELEIASEQFLVPLRMMDGFAQEKFDYLCQALRSCIVAWNNDDSIPKLAANILVDLYPATISSSYLYPEEVGAEIREHAEVLADLVREIVKV
ncbi:MAG: hypothetical protein R3C14_22535 [Caldilineaceae bacterium]